VKLFSTNDTARQSARECRTRTWFLFGTRKQSVHPLFDSNYLWMFYHIDPINFIQYIRQFICLSVLLAFTKLFWQSTSF